MAIKILHTSDWHIGKVFDLDDSSEMGQLQEARLDVINRLGEYALKHKVGHVLVAGDIYDMEALSPRSINQPLERMRNFPHVRWHLLPGNHDPHRENGLWDQILSKSLPENIHVHTVREPVVFQEESFALLPAPLYRQRTLDDPTAYMNDVDLPDDLIRIGLAHGTVASFGSDSRDAPNHIKPERPTLAGLSYLALGDWHGQRRINDRCWYSGTPETDAFKITDGGKALLVEIESPGADPVVTPIPTGEYEWEKLTEQVYNRVDIDHVAKKLRSVAGRTGRVLVDLSVEGTLSLSDRQYFEEQILEGVSAAFCFLRTNHQNLLSQPTDEDLDQIDRGGFVRAAAEELKRKAKDPGDPKRDIAAKALQRLYMEHMKLQ